MKNERLVIFDFDGVLVDSFEALYAINKLAADSVHTYLSKSMYTNFFFGNVHQNKEIFLSSDEKKIHKYNKIREESFPKYYTSRNVKLFNFVPDIIKKLSKKSRLSILSSCPEKVIVDLLKTNSLWSYFSQVIGTGKNGKRGVLKKYVKDFDKVYFITDTVGDIIEARGLGIQIIAITWGFHSKDILMNVSPHQVIDNPEDLLSII